MVNHLWLEESYAKWQVQSLTNPKYSLFPPRTNLMEVVGQTSIDPNALELSHGKDEDAMNIDINQSNNTTVDGSLVQRKVSGNGEMRSPRMYSINQRPVTPQTVTGKPSVKQPTKVSTPSRWSRVDLSETPLSTSSSGRKAKEQAAARLHDSIMPDVMKYQKEQKRKGGFMGGGRRRRSGSPTEEPALLRKRTASVSAISISEDEAKSGSKKGKKRPRPVVYLLMTAYRDWVDNPQKEEADKVGKFRTR